MTQLSTSDFPVRSYDRDLFDECFRRGMITQEEHAAARRGCASIEWLKGELILTYLNIVPWMSRHRLYPGRAEKVLTDQLLGIPITGDIE